jgi:hypothetical protein
MVDNRMSNIDVRYVEERRHYPQLDEWIDLSDKTLPRKLAKKAFVKAYCATVSGGSPFFACKECGYQNAIMAAASLLNTSPATVGLAFECQIPGGRTHGIIFEVNQKTAAKAVDIARDAKLSPVTRVRLSCRAGLGMLDLMRLTDNWKSERELVEYLDAYMREPATQMQAVIKTLEWMLSVSCNSPALAAERARNGEHLTSSMTTGKTVWQEMNRLLAAGHNSHA